METLHFEALIDAPKQKVWETMLNQETYRGWTAAFSPSSRFEGSWDKGSEIRFVDDAGLGLVGDIDDNRLHEFVAIKYKGWIKDGQVITDGDEVKEYVGAIESYTFEPAPEGRTRVKVSLDVTDKDKAMMEEKWPEALVKLKELCERK